MSQSTTTGYPSDYWTVGPWDHTARDTWVRWAHRPDHAVKVIRVLIGPPELPTRWHWFVRDPDQADLPQAQLPPGTARARLVRPGELWTWSGSEPTLREAMVSAEEALARNPRVINPTIPGGLELATWLQVQLALLEETFPPAPSIGTSRRT